MVEEASIFIPVFQEMEQLKATDEPLYNEVLPALLEYHDACDKNRKGKHMHKECISFLV